MGFKYKALSSFKNFSMVYVDLSSMGGMDRSDAQHVARLNFPENTVLENIKIDNEFIKSAINKIHKSSLNVIYFSYSRELDYFIYVVEIGGKLVFSGFIPKGNELVIDKYPVNTLKLYSPKSIVLIDKIKEYKSKKVS